jgi:hypothetical protein
VGVVLEALTRDGCMKRSVWIGHFVAECHKIDTGTLLQVYTNIVTNPGKQATHCPVHVIRPDLEDATTFQVVDIRGGDLGKKGKLLRMTHRSIMASASGHLVNAGRTRACVLRWARA